MSTAPELSATRRITSGGRFSQLAERLRYPLAVYLLSRVLYLLVALADLFIRNGRLGPELRNWDGKWYVLLAEHGYPHTIPHVYGPGGWSTLGFEPLYSMLMWLGGEAFPRGVEAWGVVISLVCGAIATVEIATLAQRWWGPVASRRGVLFFCFFPGTIVFSMTYTEGLTLALVAGALLCLEDRRWLGAGLLAGAATAVEPVAFAIIPACAAVALREIWVRGSRDGARGLAAVAHGLADRQARRSLWAPILSPWGAVGFAIFLWSWVGSPLANYQAQRIAWGEHSSILAIYIQVRTFVEEFTNWQGWHNVNLNLPAGFLGAAFMVWALHELWIYRRGLPVADAGAVAAAPPRALLGTGVSLGAWVWTVCVAVLVVTSDKTPPNPRMLICAFPLLMAFAAPRSGRRQTVLLTVTLVLLVGMSIGTFVGGGLRP